MDSKKFHIFQDRNAQNRRAEGANRNRAVSLTDLPISNPAPKVQYVDVDYYYSRVKSISLNGNSPNHRTFNTFNSFE